MFGRRKQHTRNRSGSNRSSSSSSSSSSNREVEVAQPIGGQQRLQQRTTAVKTAPVAAQQQPLPQQNIRSQQQERIETRGPAVAVQPQSGMTVQADTAQAGLTTGGIQSQRIETRGEGVEVKPSAGLHVEADAQRAGQTRGHIHGQHIESTGPGVRVETESGIHIEPIAQSGTTSRVAAPLQTTSQPLRQTETKAEVRERSAGRSEAASFGLTGPKPSKLTEGTQSEQRGISSSGMAHGGITQEHAALKGTTAQMRAMNLEAKNQQGLQSQGTSGQWSADVVTSGPAIRLQPKTGVELRQEGGASTLTSGHIAEETSTTGAGLRVAPKTAVSVTQEGQGFTSGQFAAQDTTTTGANVRVQPKSTVELQGERDVKPGAYAQPMAASQPAQMQTHAHTGKTSALNANIGAGKAAQIRGTQAPSRAHTGERKVEYENSERV